MSNILTLSGPELSPARIKPLLRRINLPKYNPACANDIEL